MRKIFYILSILTITVPAFAEGENPAVDKTRVYASASYVDGAYNALDTAKQDNITVSQAAGAIVTAVDFDTDGKTLSVTRTNQVTIPVGSADNANRATIWVE